MKDFDKKVRALAKNEKLVENLPFEKRLICMAEDLVKKTTKKKKGIWQKNFYMKYVAAVIFILLIAVYPVKAAADYLTARLASMSEEEKDELRTMVYENDKENCSLENEAIRYSRDFTEYEQKMYDAMVKQYENGIFPKDTLMISDELSAEVDDNICYNPKNKYMYLPNRELTGEELLEMIDFYFKTDYGLQTSDDTIKYKEDMKNKKLQLHADALSENEAAAIAASYVQKMYDVSIENMDKSLTADDRYYQIVFLADYVTYSVCIQADDGSFKDISMDKEGFEYYKDNIKVNESHIQKKGKEAKSIALQLLTEEETITDAYAQYKVNAKRELPHGSIVYLFDLKNGDRLRMSYSAAEDTFWGAVIENEGAGHKDRNVKKDEKRIFLRIN